MSFVAAESVPGAGRRAELAGLKKGYAQAALDNPERQRHTMRGCEIANAELGKQIRALETRCGETAAARKVLPEKVPISEVLAQERVVERGRLQGQDAIGVRVGRVVNKFKVAKHFTLDIRDDRFEFRIDEDKVAAEAALDGLYVVRTTVCARRLNAGDAVRSP